MPALIILAVLVAIASWLAVSTATIGITGMCFACFLAILARMRQADVQHTQLLEMLTATTRPLPQETHE